MDTLTFRLKVPQADVEQHILKVLQAENQINGNESKYFTGMTKQGHNFYMEFNIPANEK